MGGSFGCCAPPPVPPQNVKALVCVGVTGAVITKDKRIVRRKVYAGTLTITDEYRLLYFEERGTKAMDFFLKDVTAMSQMQSFREGARYMTPCICCCTGCADGMIDIKVTFGGSDYHVGIMIPNSKAFEQELDRLIQASKIKL